jgi:hypothetical protein
LTHVRMRPSALQQKKAAAAAARTNIVTDTIPYAPLPTRCPTSYLRSTCASMASLMLAGRHTGGGPWSVCERTEGRGKAAMDGDADGNGKDRETRLKGSRHISSAGSEKQIPFPWAIDP